MKLAVIVVIALVGIVSASDYPKDYKGGYDKGQHQAARQYGSGERKNSNAHSFKATGSAAKYSQDQKSAKEYDEVNRGYKYNYKTGHHLYAPRVHYNYNDEKPIYHANVNYNPPIPGPRTSADLGAVVPNLKYVHGRDITDYNYGLGYGRDGYGYRNDGYGYGHDGYGYGGDGYGYGRDGYNYGRDGYGYGRDRYSYGRDGYGYGGDRYGRGGYGYDRHDDGYGHRRY